MLMPKTLFLLNSKCVPSVESERLSERQNIPPLDSNEADRNTSKFLLQARLNLLQMNILEENIPPLRIAKNGPKQKFTFGSLSLILPQVQSKYVILCSENSIVC